MYGQSGVEYIDHMGSDLTVVNAARVSFNKRKTEIDNSDIRLIHYLAKHRHWTPFAHPQLQVCVTAPLFVAAQLKRHVVGASLNEISRRYVDYDPEFEKIVWRERPNASIKQGSGHEFLPSMQKIFDSKVDAHLRNSLDLYNELLERNVAPEQARTILPQSMHTSWWWTGSVAFFARVCYWRLDSHAQKETHDLCMEFDSILRPRFPHAWPALVEREKANA